MKMKTMLTTISLMLLINLSSSAQIKIGYTNIELILAYMPEVKAMEQQLATYQSKLAEDIKNRNTYTESKLQEYMSLREANRLSPAEQKAREAELLRLDEQLQKIASESDYKLTARRQELLDPLLKRVQDEIDYIAKTQGYTYILNQTTSTGVSTILYGPDENDITMLLMKKLNIAIPE